MYKLIFINIIFLLLISKDVLSQSWKKYRYEFSYGIGASNFNGDAGAVKNNTLLSDYIWFSPSSWRPVFQIGLAYKLKPRINVKLDLTSGWLSADDRYGDWAARNLQFRALIIEPSLNIEFYVVKEKKRKNIRRYGKIMKRKFQNFNLPTYFFAGVGGLYFNPKGKYKNGTWYALQPLGTEGQGIDGRDNPYSRFALSFPFGMGIKYSINNRMLIGIEAGMRYALTDYLDDVGGTYYDTQEIRDYHTDEPDIADYFSRKHAYYPNDTEQGSIVNGNGNPKGGEFIDAYQFLTFTVTYKLKTARNGLPRFRISY
ncbi:MAG: hypothetical protein KAT68_15870 [Bacteroidales bacterium]|nr:hypothetical protein [Bacteroidales bacterium]